MASSVHGKIETKHMSEELGPPPGYQADAYPVVRTRRLRQSSMVVFVGTVVSCLFALVTWTLFSKIPTVVFQFQHAHDAAPSSSQFAASLERCAALHVLADRTPANDRKTNPRWNHGNGQNETVVLRNATLFDGHVFHAMPVDIVLDKGLIVDVYASGHDTRAWPQAVEHDLHGHYVTPGLVDMHSHHLISNIPDLPSAVEDSNEMADMGPLTPFLRALDSLKAYDAATAVIASGGVTSSLIIPGSANIMGGEGTVVKNRVRPGRDGECVVEEMLLEHGVPVERRNRYMKMACGENPKKIYGHTRMGNAWLLRKHLTRARELMEKQDAWCAMPSTSQHMSRFPEEAELESTVGMLRGRVAMHNHCYEAEDLETMIRISREFAFEVRAFHHAHAAWQVPEMLKAYSPNITIAMFADLGLYKQEAYYSANLHAGKVLADHGVQFAYKSDHATAVTNAKYLLSQAAVAHSFGVPPDLALRAVTSVPAKAIDLDHRIGYARPGYDADLVVWDSHPLSVGATPLQVFIDGVATLPAVSNPSSSSDRASLPAMRATISVQEREKICSQASERGQSFVVHGIRKDLDSQDTAGNLTLVISDGQVKCLGRVAQCSAAAEAATKLATTTTTTLHLANGYLAPGLTAFTEELGMREMSLYDETGNGAGSPSENTIDYAKYGIELDGKGFARARLGGVTRAVTPPLTQGGLMQGVSVAFLTGGRRRLVSGAIVKDDVALHVRLGDSNRISPGSISLAVKELRSLLTAALVNDGGIVARVVNGSVPLVVAAKSTHDIEQVILLKRHLAELGATEMRVVVFGGHGAWQVAKELAEANISVILTANRGLFDTWETRDVLVGPPLTRSTASVLSEAGVLYAIALDTDVPAGVSQLHRLALEASWAAKYAGLGEQDAIRLVSRNLEDILGLERSGDFVVWEGSPLQFGTPVLAFHAVPNAKLGSVLELENCWPSGEDA